MDKNMKKQVSMYVLELAERGLSVAEIEGTVENGLETSARLGRCIVAEDMNAAFVEETGVTLQEAIDARAAELKKATGATS